VRGGCWRQVHGRVPRCDNLQLQMRSYSVTQNSPQCCNSLEAVTLRVYSSTDNDQSRHAQKARIDYSTGLTLMAPRELLKLSRLQWVG
jgi:hypothetical protein